MIVKMSKYSFVLYHKSQEEFLLKLQELGLVDITTTGWEPDADERALLAAIDQHRAAEMSLKELVKDKSFIAGEPFATGEEAFKEYQKAAAEIDSLKVRVEKSNKEAEELRVWGDFSPNLLKKLADDGITLRFFSTGGSEFEKIKQTFGEEFVIEKIGEYRGSVYFVVVQTEEATITFDAQEHKAPAITATEKDAYTAELEEHLSFWRKVMSRAAVSVDLIAEHRELLMEKLQLSQVSNSGQREADGALIVMEGWAVESTSAEIDKVLNEYPDVVYLKERPTPEDDTPVVLKNGPLSSAFEIIGGMYTPPKYGTVDLTRFFGPFYMLFFAFCLGDAGYGLVLFLGGLFMLKKPSMRKAAKLVLLCGGAAVVFGLLIGSFFGMPLAEQPVFASVKDLFIETNSLFYIALGLGLLQIIFGLIMNVVKITVQSGFKYSLGVLGWIIIILGLICGVGLPMMDMGIPGFTSDSIPFYIVMGIGAVCMLLLNNPKRNPLINFGAGLWDTYNNVTGLFGDLLSYIRLFALCLSGGTLALVFNDLAFGLAPDIPVVKQIFVLIILLIGHGINLFMSAIGSFVHPMRLTFVEFYKNAGFESSLREFTPLKKRSNK